MIPSPELKARVLAAASKDKAADRRAVRRRALWSWLAVVTFTLLAFGAVGGLRAVERPLSFVLATAAGWAGIALAASWASSRKGSMVGRPLGVLVGLTLATPAALAAWYLAWVGRVPMPPAPVDRAFVCLAVSLVFAAGPFVLLARSLRATAPAHPRATAAAIGVVTCAWASVLMDLHCERGDLVHVTLGHVAPALVLALVGFALGERLFRADFSPRGDLS